jgi:CRISPR/Cas system-associated endonuclease Cas3-HD
MDEMHESMWTNPESVYRECRSVVIDVVNELAIAALMHDIGKKFTKKFEDSKGNPTDVAHFYGHQNVSPYMSLFYLRHLSKEKILETTKYIQWHMHPMNISTEKARCKAINLLGEEFYNNLLKLHEADINAK